MAKIMSCSPSANKMSRVDTREEILVKNMRFENNGDVVLPVFFSVNYT